MMRKSLWIILALLLVASVSPNAHAQDFTYTVTNTLPGYESSWTTEPISLELLSTDLAPADLVSTSVTGSEVAGCNVSSGVLDAFGYGEEITTFGGTTCAAPYRVMVNGDGFRLSDYSTPGTYTGSYDTMVVTAVETPEPATFGLVLTGAGLLGFMMVMRKR